MYLSDEFCLLLEKMLSRLQIFVKGKPGFSSGICTENPTATGHSALGAVSPLDKRKTATKDITPP